MVNIASLILRGPHATMIVGAVSGLSQSTLNSPEGNPPYRTLFNMACLILRVQVAGQVYQRLGGTPNAELATVGVPLVGMALTHLFASTVPIAIAVALTMKRSGWRVWRTDFTPSAPSYGLGAAAVVVVIAVTESAGYWLTLLDRVRPTNRNARGAASRSQATGASGSVTRYPRASTRIIRRNPAAVM